MPMPRAHSLRFCSNNLLRPAFVNSRNRRDEKAFYRMVKQRTQIKKKILSHKLLKILSA